MKNNLKEQNEMMIQHLIYSGALKTTKVIEAFRKVPRHLFVVKEYLSSAYVDIPLPTMKGQTISQPTTVAIMTEALEPKSGEKILEIGAGSSWQAALLGYCVGKEGKVITVEMEPTLVKFAKKNLKKVKIKNVKVICWDGKKGYKKEAPYDKCIITAACPEIPKPVIKQMKKGGRIVAPVNHFFGQRMMVIDKISEKQFKKKDLGSFIFVPLR